MSQVVKLKRTAVEGKVPNTSNIELGELAINTFDGRIFFEKDNGTPSIQQVVTTNSQTTGSLNILGSVTASFFVGDGSQLRNLPNSDVSQVATVTASFQDTSSISVNHNFNSRNVIVSVYDSSYSQLIPTSVVLTNSNNVDITLSGPHSGFAVVAKGGHIVSGTLVQEVSEVSTVTASFDNQSTIVVTHSFESKNVIISVYDSNDSQLIPQSVTLTDLNTATIVLSGNHSGFVVVAKGGHFVTGSEVTSYTNLTNKPIGLVSGSSQLTSSYDLRYALSGSAGGGGGTSDFTQLTNIPSGLVSESSQVVSILTPLNTYTASQSTSSLATTGSNTFVGTQTFSGSLIPATDNTYDLGSPTKQFRDLYLSSASLYIDGTKVLGSTAQELTITTDNGQSIKILEAGSDSIILQSADGDIELKSSGGGDILLDPTAGLISVKGTLQIQDGNRITSSGGNSIQFGNDLGITGSLSTSGNINGINLTSFSSSLSTQIKSIQSSTSSTEERWAMFFTYTSSNDTTNTTQNSRLTSLETASGSYETKGRGIVSGSSQIIDVLSSLNTYTSSNDTTNTTQNSRLTSLETKSGSVDSSISNINSFTSSNGNTALNDYTSSLKTAISVSGQNVTVNGNFTVSGTQTIVDSTTVQIGDNILELNGSGATNAGLLVKDPTAPNTISGSLIWDSTNDHWRGGALGSESKLLLANGDNVVSGSSQVVGILSSLNTYTGSNDTTNTTQNSRLTSIESATGSYETRGRGIVSGSSQITLSSTNGYGSVLNQAVLTTSSPTFAGGTFTSNSGITVGANGRAFIRQTVGGDAEIGAPTNGVLSLFSNGSSVLSFTGAAAATFASSVNASTFLSSGWFAAPNNFGLTATNAAGTAGRVLIKLNTSNQIEIGRDTDISQIRIGTASANDAFTIISNGNTGINTTSPAERLQVNGNIQLGSNSNQYIRYRTASAWDYYLKSDSDDFVIYDSQNTEFFRAIYNGGGTGKYAQFLNSLRAHNNTNVTVLGTLTENSSIRYKENVETLTNSLDKVIQLRGVTYTKKDTGLTELGLIAEEVNEILPEVVLKNEEGEPDSVSYGRITALLIEAIKDLKREIEELKGNR